MEVPLFLELRGQDQALSDVAREGLVGEATGRVLSTRRSREIYRLHFAAQVFLFSLSDVKSPVPFLLREGSCS